MRSDVDFFAVVMRAVFLDQLIVTYGRACLWTTLTLLTVDVVLTNVYYKHFLYDTKNGR